LTHKAANRMHAAARRLVAWNRFFVVIAVRGLFWRSWR